jgi:hypothetical protein
VSGIGLGQNGDGYFAGGLGGFAILSGDARSDFQTGAVASLYSARSGLAANGFVGRHWNDWVSLQGNYIFNRNEVTLAGVDGARTYEAINRTQQHKLVLDGMLYFRSRRDRIRPYLSVGVGAVRTSRAQDSIALSTPAPVSIPSNREMRWMPGLRVAVGIDLLLRSGWGFRYSFSETVTENRFSKALIPAGNKGLMNFQNLFGIVRYF